MFELISNPRDVLESEFPVMGTPAEQLRFLLNYAVLAPSRHNAQPWLFKVDGDTVELYADRSRSLPVMDPDDRELTIGCGAALANLIIAIRHFGYAPAVEIHSHHDQGRLLARVTLETGVRATSEEQRLFSALLQRRTNRQPFEDRPLPASLLSALEEMAMQEGASLRFVREEETRYALASLIATGDRMLWTDERFRQEVATWTRPVESQARDGVPAYALGKGEMGSYLGPLKIRTFMEQTELHPHEAGGSPVLAVLWTFADTWFDWLAAGQALEKILLRAAAEGVWASFFSQPIEVPALRTEILTLFGQTDFPQMVLRMGYGQQTPPTPRRSVRDVLLPRDGNVRPAPSRY